jgi:hypothetical protein
LNRGAAAVPTRSVSVAIDRCRSPDLPELVNAVNDARGVAGGLGQTELAERIAALPTARTAALIDTGYAGAFAARDAVLRQSRDRLLRRQRLLRAERAGALRARLRAQGLWSDHHRDTEARRKSFRINMKSVSLCLCG